ncbi:hypothetical protein EDB89DRAFT_1905828 [Lactarius sanguifluus]|nr:hypothetical protein EDB89DRAFT_1905828 [Lactarius sanguifluus]
MDTQKQRGATRTGTHTCYDARDMIRKAANGEAGEGTPDGTVTTESQQSEGLECEEAAKTDGVWLLGEKDPSNGKVYNTARPKAALRVPLLLRASGQPGLLPDCSPVRDLIAGYHVPLTCKSNFDPHTCAFPEAGLRVITHGVTSYRRSKLAETEDGETILHTRIDLQRCQSRPGMPVTSGVR